jgi:hypothetical protein
MAAVKIKADVPSDRRVTLELPPDFPTGPVELEVRIAPRPDEIIEIPVDSIDLSKIPHYVDPNTGERRPLPRSGLVREVRKPDQ